MKKTIRAAAAVATVGIGALALGVAPAGATSGLTFDGSCSFADLHAHTDKPFLLVQQEIELKIDGPGTCTGVAGGTPVTRAPVTLHAVTNGRSSTAYSERPLVGTATIDLGGGASIETEISVVLSVPVTFTVRLQGASGSTASGLGFGHGLETLLRPLPKIVGIDSQDGYFSLAVKTNGSLISK